MQQIKDLADIVELISELIPVKRSGHSYLALCPFHNDSHPSMHISPTKGIFKCFSCGIGGDVFKFWQEYYQKDFKETLKDLAQKYGVVLEQSFSQESTEVFNLKIKMHTLAAKYYHDQLLASQEATLAREYLAKREIMTATINRYELGYSPSDPNNWGKLINFLQSELSCTEAQIVEAGLALQSEKNNRYYDRFRGRLMIPIFDERGRVIAFGARALGDEQPKYINSPETSIYHKGNNLYGINLAKESIRKEDAVIVVEGYFDLISLHDCGITNVVANQGTALTAQQIKLLAKYTHSKQIYLCFDSDAAGKAATDKAAELIMQILAKHNYQLKVLEIPGNKDADEFIREHGQSALLELQSLIKAAPGFIDYKITQVYNQTDLKDLQAKSVAVSELARFLRYVDNQIILSEHIKEIAFKFKLDEQSLSKQLKSEFGRNEPTYSSAAQVKPTVNVSKKIEPVEASERELLMIAIKDKACAQKILEREFVFTTDSCRRIFDALIDLSFAEPDLVDINLKFQALSSVCVEDASLLADLGMKLERDWNIGNLDELLVELMTKVDELRLQIEIKEMVLKLQELDDSTEEWLAAYAAKNKLDQQLHKLKKTRMLNF